MFEVIDRKIVIIGHRCKIPGWTYRESSHELRKNESQVTWNTPHCRYCGIEFPTTWLDAQKMAVVEV